MTSRPVEPNPTGSSSDEPIVLPGGVAVPGTLLSFQFVRGGGPGGQNVNKVNTKAVLRVAAADLERVIGEAPAARLRRIAAGRINSDDELLITSEEHRSQHRNRAACIDKLRQLLVRAMVRPKRRRVTKPSRGAIERRLESKKRQSEIKRRRSGREW